MSWSLPVPSLRILLGASFVAAALAALAACETPGAQANPGAPAPSLNQDEPRAAADVPAAVPIAAPPEVAQTPAENVPPAVPEEKATAAEPAAVAAQTDESAAMFNDIAKVLQHPRCMNCHVSGKSPKQGDDQRVHMPPVERGADGRGAGLTCKTCHTDKNGPVAPGAPDWHLAPMEMAWEGLSVSELCRAVADTAKNGGRDAKALALHLTEDPLVRWGWNPGGARKPVPIAQADFAKLVHAWVDAGARCP